MWAIIYSYAYTSVQKSHRQARSVVPAKEFRHLAGLLMLRMNSVRSRAGGMALGAYPLVVDSEE